MGEDTDTKVMLLWTSCSLFRIYFCFCTSFNSSAYKEVFEETEPGFSW